MTTNKRTDFKYLKSKTKHRTNSNQNDNMKITAIIPTYNNETTIKECIESLKNQTLKISETILIDSNSKDKTREIAKRLQCTVYNIKSNRSEARNIGAKKAKNNIIAFIESDSVYDKNWSKYVHEEFKKGANAVIDRRAVHKPKTLISKINNEIFNIRCKNYTPFSMWIIKKDLFQKLKGFDETLEAAEDRDFGDRLIKSNHKISFAKKAIQYHKGEPSTLKETLTRAWWFGKHMPKYYKKHKEKIPYTRMILFMILNISILIPKLFLLLIVCLYTFTAIKNIKTDLKPKYSIPYAGIAILREESSFIATILKVLHII